MLYESVTGEGYANYYLLRWFDGYRVCVWRIATLGPEGVRLLDEPDRCVWLKQVLDGMRAMSPRKSEEIRCGFWNRFGIA